MMLRLLNAEGYKIRKSKSFYVSVIVMAVFIIFMYAMLMLVDSVLQGDIDNGTAGIIVAQEGQQNIAQSGGSVWDEVGILEMLQQVFSGDLVACVLAIYVTVVVVSEYSSGMVKNIVGKGSSRAVVFLSKLTMSVLSSILITLIGCATALVCGAVFIGTGAFTGDFWRNLAIYIGLQILLMAALAALYVLAAEVTRSYAAGISAGIGVATLPVLLLTGVDAVCAKYGFTLSPYWLVTRSGECPVSGFTAEFVLETVLVAAVWFLLAAALGTWHFSRSDVK